MVCLIVYAFRKYQKKAFRHGVIGAPNGRLLLSEMGKSMSGWYPNHEPSVLLECGCIDIPWGAIWCFGERKQGGKAWRLGCRRHEYPPHPAGWRIIRKATPSDYEQFLSGICSTLF